MAGLLPKASNFSVLCLHAICQYGAGLVLRAAVAASAGDAQGIKAPCAQGRRAHGKQPPAAQLNQSFIVMIVGIVQQALQGRVRVALYLGMAPVHHQNFAGRLAHVNFDPDMLHEGIGADGRVAAPRAMQEALRIMQPSGFKTTLVGGLVSHESSHFKTQRLPPTTVLKGNCVKEAIPVPGHSDPAQQAGRRLPKEHMKAVRPEGIAASRAWATALIAKRGIIGKPGPRNIRKEGPCRAGETTARRITCSAARPGVKRAFFPRGLCNIRVSTGWKLGYFRVMSCGKLLRAASLSQRTAVSETGCVEPFNRMARF